MAKNNVTNHDAQKRRVHEDVSGFHDVVMALTYTNNGSNWVGRTWV
jgi:hypothetical protein